MCEEASGDSTRRYYPRLSGLVSSYRRNSESTCMGVSGAGRGGVWIFKFFLNSNVPQGNYKTAAITGRADLCFRATPEKREVDGKSRSIGEKEEDLL